MNQSASTGEAAAQDERWRRWVDSRAHESLPFAEQLRIFERTFAGRSFDAGPPIAWRPGEAELTGSNLAIFLEKVGLDSYRDLHAWSVREREPFWGAVLEHLGIVMEDSPSRILDLSEGVERARWLVDARLNIVDSCFAAEPDAPAVIWRQEGSAELRTLDSRQLAALVDEYAAGFQFAGLAAGDRLGFYLPLTVDCVAAYLGAARAGLEVVSIASSFAAHEVERRVELGKCKALLVAASFERAGKRHSPYAVALEAGTPRIIVLGRDDGEIGKLRAGDLWAEELLGRGTAAERHVAGPDRVTNVLFSSGTTGDPKAIPWTQLQPIKCAMDGHFHHDIRPGDVVAWPTDIGWMMGPWLIYASLINGATIALFDGAPTGREFTRFVGDAGVTMLGVVPSLVRSWRRSGATEGSRWGALRVFSSTGEASNSEDYLWLMSRVGYRAPVIEYCGGTEIGGGYVTGTVLEAASPATFNTPALGLDFVILDAQGRVVPETGSGELFLVPPSVGLSESLLNADHREVYFEGCPRGPGGEVLRRHGDQMARLPGGFFQALGRADDTMNLGGIKVSSLEIERTAGLHDDVEECAAVSLPGSRGGPEELILFAVLAAGREIDPESLRLELSSLIAGRLNPLFKLSRVMVVDRLPRTASNKLMRRRLRSQLTDSGGSSVDE